MYKKNPHLDIAFFLLHAADSLSSDPPRGRLIMHKWGAELTENAPAGAPQRGLPHTADEAPLTPIDLRREHLVRLAQCPHSLELPRCVSATHLAS